MKKGFRNFVLLCVGVGVVGVAMAATGAALGNQLFPGEQHQSRSSGRTG